MALRKAGMGSAQSRKRDLSGMRPLKPPSFHTFRFSLRYRKRPAFLNKKTLRILILKPSKIDRSIRGRCAFRDREYAEGHSTERKAQMRPGGS